MLWNDCSPEICPVVEVPHGQTSHPLHGSLSLTTNIVAQHQLRAQKEFGKSEFSMETIVHAFKFFGSY